ncbi:MAG: hypothetical protein ACP5OO_08515 [Chloroflexia bacterium]
MSEERRTGQTHDRWIALVAWLALLAFGIAISVYGATTGGMMGGLLDWMRSLLATVGTSGRPAAVTNAITLSAVSLGLVALSVALLIVAWLYFIRLSKELFSAYEMPEPVATLYRPLIRLAGQVLLFFVLSVAVSLLSQSILSLLQNLLLQR